MAPNTPPDSLFHCGGGFTVHCIALIAVKLQDWRAVMHFAAPTHGGFHFQLDFTTTQLVLCRNLVFTPSSVPTSFIFPFLKLCFACIAVLNISAARCSFSGEFNHLPGRPPLTSYGSQLAKFSFYFFCFN